MNRKLKALGLALVAVMAMAALSASTASAEFHSAQSHTIIDGAQPEGTNDVGSYDAGNATCKSVTYSGTQSTATASTQTVTPAYTECTAFGFVGATIHTNGCTYEFTTTNTPTPATAERLHIKCPVGKQIEVTAFNCHVDIPAQTLKGITYTNNAGKTDFTFSLNISGITYTQTNKSFPFCIGGAGTFSNGRYAGAATVTGTDTDKNPVSIWTSHTQ